VNFQRSKELRQRSHHVIPGGAHTYAKGDDQYPEEAPGFIDRGEGCRVWDLDGNEFIEYGMGLRAVTLGHAYKPVVEAAYRAMQGGTNFTRPGYIELECAEEFLSIIRGADMVKFAKNGSDVMTAAVKLARAHTGRKQIAICGSHPFFSIDDWFIGSTVMDAGIPQEISALTLKFQFNDAASLRRLFTDYPAGIAGVVLEPATSVEPETGFLEDVRDLCTRNGAVLIFDEMITGFRWHLGGAQEHYGVVPDLSAFGKALANGFSVSALAGKREIMELGGLTHSKERVFLLSTTHGAETHALAAAIETMRIYKREPVIEHLHYVGTLLSDGVQRAAENAGVGEHVQALGRPSNLIYATRDTNKTPSQAFRTLFLQETIKRGVLMPSLVASYSHSEGDVRRTIEGIAEALSVYRKALDDGVEKYLVGRPVKPVFRKLN
jgi:glutamate-1-semialdehyde 2,1-aminomutase